MKQAEIDSLWQDLVSEEDVIKKTTYTKRGLASLRVDKLKAGIDWFAIKNRNIMYSKKSLLKILNIIPQE